ncbi:hypothetical protein ACQP2F_21665 [Actinoplanes sp. CA-030573]|uniref:hypothetical protein n=1 Tax=Actinoplanes sp. CA-030573 TaxID=3239898 RepID=UPI003D91D01B
MPDRLHSRSGPEVPPDAAAPPPVIDEPTQKMHIVWAPPTRVAARAVLVYEQSPRKPWRLWAFTAVLVALTIGVVLGQAEAFQPVYRGSTAQAAVVPAPATPATPSLPAPVVAGPVTAPLGTAKALTFEVAGRASVVHIAAADLGAQLYSIVSTDPTIAPRVTDTGRGPRLDLDRAGAEIRLSTKVAWTIRLTAGASDQDVDMTAGGLAGIQLAGPTARAALRLPVPEGTVKVAVTGAVSELRLLTTAPVRLTLGKGADVAVTAARTRRKVEPGTTLTPSGWKKAKRRYDVTTAAAVGSVSVPATP